MPPKRRRGASTTASKAKQAPKATATKRQKNLRTARQQDIVEKRKEDEATKQIDGLQAPDKRIKWRIAGSIANKNDWSLDGR
jgi:hypothetical protein